MGKYVVKKINAIAKLKCLHRMIEKEFSLEYILTVHVMYDTVCV